MESIRIHSNDLMAVFCPILSIPLFVKACAGGLEGVCKIKNTASTMSASQARQVNCISEMLGPPRGRIGDRGGRMSPMTSELGGFPSARNSPLIGHCCAERPLQGICAPSGPSPTHTQTQTHTHAHTHTHLTNATMRQERPPQI